MRRLLFTLFLIPFFTIATFAQQQCFKAFIAGQEVSVICVGEPVQFEDCFGLPPGTVEYYDLGDKPGGVNFVPADLNSPTRQYFFNTPGTFTVTRLYSNPPQPGSTFSRTFVVKPKPKPTFTASQCGNDSVTINITDTNYDAYTLTIGSNSQPVLSGQIYRFPSPGGTYDVTLSGKYTLGNCGESDKKTLTATPPPTKPNITKSDVLGTAASGKIQFTVSGLQPDYIYKLEEQNGSAFSPKSTLNFRGAATDTFTISGLNTTVQNCYRVRVFDKCGFSQGEISQVICSEVLTVTAQNKKNEVSWSPYIGNTPNGGSFSYNLYRREAANPPVLLKSLSDQNAYFEDTTVICGLNYCYELAVSQGTDFSISNAACATAVSTDIPKAAKLLTSFSTGNILQGTLTLPTNSSLNQVQVSKSLNGGNYTFLKNSITTDFQDSDKNYKIARPCYKVTYTDNCGNRSAESNESCPVILTAEHDKLKRTVTLNWNAYSGFEGTTIDYTLELLDENFNPKTALNQLVNGVFTFTDSKLSDTEQTIRYRIKAQSNLNEVSYSNTEIIVQEVKIFVPTAFTPNNDGLNDVFEVKGRFQNNFSLLILNRWGQVIFESKDPKKGWDGKINGNEAPVGVYAFKLSATDERGQHFEKSGTLTLLK